MDWRGHLTSNPKICGGQLCAKGTRVMVSVILDSFAEGSSPEAILKSYPSLSVEHLHAALAYAASLGPFDDGGRAA